MSQTAAPSSLNVSQDADVDANGQDLHREKSRSLI